MHKILKTGVVAAVLAVGALVPATPASAEFISAGVCPDGYYGAVVGITTSQTGQREIYACFKRIDW